MSDNEPSAVIIRPAGAEDVPRVVRYWLSSFRNSRWAGPIPNNLYKKVYAEGIRQLLTRGATLEVACFRDQPALLVGFACTEHTPRDRILHYVFVRSEYRRQGVASALLESAAITPPFVYTYRTDDMVYLAAGGRHMRELACRKEAHKPDPASQEEMN